MKKFAFSLLAIALAFAASAERQPFERYESIVTRQMFGPPPEGFDPTKPPSEAVTSRAQQKQDQELAKQQEKLKSAIRFSMINVTPSGETAVGFTDATDAKSPRHLYLKVGETGGGWTVKEADAARSSMTIVNSEGVEVSLKIGGDSAKGAGSTTSAAMRTGGAANGGRSLLSGGSLRTRRNQRRAEENARMEAQRRQLQEQQAAFEKRQQEERQAREEREEQQKAEREEQRKQLLQIQEELKRAREEKAEKEKTEASETKSEEQE